jgi:phytoene synthase
MPTVEESFAHCRRVARSRARNFYYSFLLLPRQERDAMCAIYAFMRKSDDITDGVEGRDGSELRAGGDGEPEIVLARWKSSLEAALDGRCGDNPILPALRHTVGKYRIPVSYLFELIEGVRSDLRPPRHRTFKDLYEYCYRVASVVGLTSIHVFGYESDEALPLAEKCGIAFQLTNILRDIPEDAGLGRVYFPEEELEKFGLTPADLLDARPGSRFREFMEYQWARANRYYQEAAPLLGMIRPKSRPALWAMVSIYKGILQQIRHAGYDVYARRPKLTAWEKSWIVARAMRSRWTGGALSFPA